MPRNRRRVLKISAPLKDESGVILRIFRTTVGKQIGKS